MTEQSRKFLIKLGMVENMLYRKGYPMLEAMVAALTLVDEYEVDESGKLVRKQ